MDFVSAMGDSLIKRLEANAGITFHSVTGENGGAGKARTAGMYLAARAISLSLLNSLLQAAQVPLYHPCCAADNM